MTIKIRRHTFCFFLVCCCFPYSRLEAGVFDTLLTVPAGERLDVAAGIFSRYVEAMDSMRAFTEIGSLLDIARKLNDRKLEVAAISYKGIYCFNVLSGQQKWAITYLKDAISLSETYGLDMLSEKLIHQLGLSYYLMKNYPLAFEHFLMADKQMKERGYSTIPHVAAYLYTIGWAYHEFRNLGKASYFFKEALKYPGMEYRDRRAMIAANNGLGTIYVESQAYDSALYHYRQALALAEQVADTALIGIIKGNLGDIYVQKNEPEQAKPFLLEGYKLNLRTGNWRGAGKFLLTYVKIDLAENKLSEAEKKIREIQRLINDHAITDLELKAAYFEQSAALHRRQQRYDLALAFQDSFIRVKDSIVKQKDASLLANAEMQQITEKHLADLQLLEKEKEIQQVIRNAVILFCILVVLFFIIFIRNFRIRQQRKQKILELEKSKAENELHNAEKTLRSYMSSIREKNKLIRDFKQEIEHLKVEAHPVVMKVREQAFEKLCNATILTEEDWKKFRRMFDEVYKGFFLRLNEKYPELTAAEKRLIALIKLDLSYNEIASMIGISPESVKQTSLRLRKKLNIKANIDLFELVETI